MIATVHIEKDPASTLAETYSRTFTYGPDNRQFYYVRNEHVANGGYWQLLLKIRDTPVGLEELFLKGLNRKATAIGERGTKDFEGYVQAVRYYAAGGIYFKTLDRVANKVFARYKDSTGVFARSTAVQDTASQNLYGVLEFPFSAGQLPSASLAENVSRRILAKRRMARGNPEQLAVSGSQGDEDHIELLCYGFIRRFARRTYNQTAITGTQSADLEIADILAATGSGIIKTQRLQPNPIGVSREYDADRSPLAIMQDIARLGDSLFEPWVIYMAEDQAFVYEPAAPAEDVNL